MNSKKILALDTETFYDDVVSVSTMGLYHYTHHFAFECYMISVVGSDGFEWCGHPDSAPWDKFREYDTWISHNKGFDHAVVERLIEQGIAPADIMPPEWSCTANMSVYFGLPRALAQIVGVVYNTKVDKSLRNVDMKGLHRQDMSDELYDRVLKYALDDSRWCLKLWQDFSAEWPEMERKMSEHTYMMGRRGIYCDHEALGRDIDLLTRAKEANLKRIPWWETGVPLSKKHLKTMCSENGVEMPASLAEDSEECAAWENKYGDQFPWINAMRNYRRINTVLKKCETMRRRVMPNGRVEFSFLYFGGDTGRWSGTGGWNPQNLPQSPFYFDADLQLTEEKTDLSVDLRARLTAGPGMTLAVSDLSAIEPRAASFMSRNKAMLEAFRAGFGPYAALARATMGWDGKDLAAEDPELYALCKAKSLAFMYGAGWLKFIDMAPMYIGQANADKILKVRPPEHEIVAFDAFIMGNEFNAGHVAKFKTNTEEQNWVWCNAWIHMRDFRAAHPELVAVWKTCGETLKKSIGGTCEIGIPSGRTLRFFNVTKRADGMVCRTTRGGSFYKYYAAKVFQNANQAFARDIFAEAILRVEAAGYRVVLHVHDEVVVEVPLGFDPKLLTALMVVPPAWCRSIPLASKTKLMPRYTK